MSEQKKTQEPHTSQQPGNQPIEPVDLALAHLTAFIQSLEEKRDKEAEQAQIPADIPRFVTYG